MGQIGAQWSSGKDVFNASLRSMPDPKVGKNTHETKLSYSRKVSERMNLATEFKYSHPEKESALHLAYEYLITRARIQELLDTDGKVNCSFPISSVLVATAPSTTIVETTCSVWRCTSYHNQCERIILLFGLQRQQF